MNRAWLLPLTLLIGGSLIGCDVQSPINRVQPNVTPKADLRDSEWYSLSTVVDTPYAADFTFVGEQGTLERIRWEIQEDFLVGRRSYETIAGADPEGINGTDESAAAPVAMFKILKHFDIRHQYNPVTGEKMNVIEENSTDRPWHQRDYMRVDWSKNLVNDPNFMMLSRFFNALEMEPVAWFVQEEEGVDSPNAPKFVRANEEDGPVEHVKHGDLTYMEITNKMFVKPTNYFLRGFGPIPACWLLQVMDGNPVDCASSEITVRHSFLRVDPNHDYEPQVYTGDRMERFGYFVTERPGYDAHYGLVEPLRYRFVNRHNLWKESHKRDGDEYVTCTEDADCADGRGSFCDLDWGRARRQLTEDDRIQGACTIPYRDREVRPVVYHLTENWPEEFLPEAEMVAREYSQSFGNVIASLREIECQANEPDGTDCSAERGREDQGSLFHVCPSPVPAGAPEECGPEGTVGRIGDLRYSLIAWVNEPHRSSPLGYGPSAADPLTGEIIAGNSFIYGAGVDTISTFGRDIVKLLNGELTEEEVAAGAPVDAWAMRLSGEMRGQSTRTAHDHTVPVDGHDVARINEAMDFSWARTPGNTPRGAAQSPAEFVQRMEDARRRIRDSGVAGDGIDRGSAALARLRGTDIEAWMTTPEMLAAANIDPGTPLDEDVLELASPLRAQRAQSVIERLRLRDRIQQQQGVDWGDFGDEGLLGLARDIVRKAAAGEPMEWNGVEYHFHNEDGTVDYAKVRTMLRHPIMTGLTLHEVGHTVGLRHNFSGSFDALNYHPRYWELRDDGNMRPRAWDPLTDEEINGRIYEYSYSTVMDYGHNFVVSDAHGLGHYDHAALKMGYGDLVEVFTEPTRNNTEVAWATYIQMLGWPVTLSLDAALGRELTAYPYTEWPALLGGRENIEKRADVPYTSLVNEDVLFRSGIEFRGVDPQQRIAVPYRFCSDEQRDLNPDCFLYDSGADAYESVQSVIDSYWNYYIFNSYRRGRIGFNASGVANRIFGRYFEKLQRANQTYTLYRAIFQEGWSDMPGYDAFFEAERGFGAFTAAVGAAFQTLTRVIGAPEPGGYAERRRGDGTMAFLPVTSAAAETVDGYDGRYLETTWDFDAGYFWFDQLERVGYFYDKAYALIALSDPTTYFLGRDTDADIRRYQINFASSFGPSLTRLFGGMLSEDWQTFAPRFVDGVLVYPDPLEIERRSMPGTPVSPNVSFSIQLYASIFGMTYIPQTYDQDFLNRSRIFVRGGAEELQIAGLPQIEYTDSQSGITYVAVSYLDTEGVEQGVGANLLNHAKALETRAATSEQAAFELRRFIDNIDLVRRLTWQLGFGAQP